MHLLIGLTLWRNSDFVRTPRQAPVVRVQASHMTGAVAARGRTLYILLICAWRFCRQGNTPAVQQ